MERKATSGIMLTLLLISVLTLAFGVQPVKAESKTIYVDDDNIAGPWDGTQEHPYQNITSGLEHASANDTIYVYKGTYFESVVVPPDHEFLKLLGEDKSGTIVNATGTSDYGNDFTVYARNVQISGFTLLGAHKGIYVWRSDNIIISNNIITETTYGIWIDNSYNVTICDNSISNNFCGINTMSMTGQICENVIFSHEYYGLVLMNFDDSLLIKNTISANNATGLTLYNSSRNHIHQNNFIDNRFQLDVRENSISNVWDDSYPPGGNYWSDYGGVDFYSGPYQNETGSDGIGDMPYFIDVNNKDRYPFIGPFNTFDAGTWNGIPYHVDVVSNSTISAFYFDPDEGAFLRFNVTGESGTTGFCRVTIPKDLLWVENGWTVLVGDEPVEYTTILDENCTYLYFIYNHSTIIVKIQGTHVVPEFPSSLILPLFMVLTMVAVVFVKKRKFKI